jgi:hypothetical protein
MSMSERIPAHALWLGLGGLIPFYASAAAAFAPEQMLRGAGFASFAIYGAVILSFLGGVRWGLALTTSPLRTGALIASVLPSIFGWLAAGAIVLGWTAAGAAGLMALGFLGQYLWDRTAPGDGAPPWYPVLRRYLTLGVLGACLALAASTALQTG